MTELFLDVGSFSLKALILGLVVFGGIVAIITASLKQKKSTKELEVEDLTKKFKKQKLQLQSKILPHGEFKKILKSERKTTKKEAKKAKDLSKARLFILRFEGDVKASQTEELADQITAVLSIANPKSDRVLVAIESPGGMVHGYGLAAAQLLRIRERGISLIAAVDKVAASGGYLMASVANEIIAAPFAVLGSIGVLAQVPNLNRLLKKHDIDYEEITSGKYKRSVSFLGEITPDGKKHFEKKVEGTHDLFKQFVKDLRPNLNLDEVANGDHWYGKEALALGLVDRIQTSDEYISNLAESHQIIKISSPDKKNIIAKFSQSAEASIERVFYKLLSTWPVK